MLWGMTMDSHDAVRIRGLRKSYGELTALDGVDLTVARGEVLALLGPNGAGKTTMVEILEGHRKADAGHVSVLGYDPGKRERGFRERIGIVLQEAGLDPTIKVREAIELYGAAYPQPAARAGAARAGRARRPRRRPRRRPLRRPAPPAGPRARPGRRPRPDLPRRADDGLRSRRAPPVMGDDLQPALARQVDPADHALHGGGAAPRRPRRRARQGPDRGRGHAGRARQRRRRRRSSASACPPTTTPCRCPTARPSSAERAASAPRRRRRPRAAARMGRRARHGARTPDRHPSHARGRLSRPTEEGPHEALPPNSRWPAGSPAACG